jgi:hypothetical protein
MFVGLQIGLVLYIKIKKLKKILEKTFNFILILFFWDRNLVFFWEGVDVLGDRNSGLF